eukprot:jgi/Ulvmu1/846/UM010_0220.1
MADRLAVVDPKYCSQVDVVLTIKEVSSWSGNDFRVTDAETGNLLFTCEGKALSSREEKVLADAAGAEVARMRHPIMETWMSRMKVEGPGYSFNVTEKFKFSNEAKAEVTDLISREERILYIYGNWSARTKQVYDGKKKEKGRMLAYCEQKLTWSWHGSLCPALPCI